MKQHTPFEVATLAGGCFWCIEAVFREIDGVERVVSGYTGGVTVNPTYEQVCADTTGHAEAVQVTFDPAKISYRDILEIFFSIHDPTTVNRQGADMGTQYRSAIFYHDHRQKAIAKDVVEELNESGQWAAPVVTEIEPFGKFYSAEEHHQDYSSKHPERAYCQLVISPKVDKFRKHWARRLRRQTTT